MTKKLVYSLRARGSRTDPSGNNAIVIKRRIRRSEQVSQTQAVYYILDGTIYQCPTVHELLTSRLNKCAHHLEKTFDELRARYDALHEKNLEEMDAARQS